MSNQTLETIRKRRSVRCFKPDPIPDDTLRLILEAGVWAPSAMNEQPWYFLVVKSAEALHKVYAACGGESRFYHAPEAILVFSQDGVIAPVQDASLAIENMLLAAASLGVATCWIHSPTHFFASPEASALRAELGVPENYSCVGSFALGFNGGDTPSAKPRKNGSYRIV